MIRAVLLILAVLALMSPISWATASGEIPPSSLKIPAMVKEQSVSTYLPSASAPGQGLAVNIIYPQKARYKAGAPIVVVVPGGDLDSGLDFSMHAAQQGFIEVRFAFPGGGKEGFSSAGIYDHRGVHSQEALKDVLRFAAGKLPDHQGRTLGELIPTKLAGDMVGAVGWSNGGNIVLVTLSKFADDLRFLKWLAFYESPLGQLFFPPALGGAQDLLSNRHYRQGTAATGRPIVDFRRLRWQSGASKSPGAHKKVGEPEIAGVLFFDENGNGNWEESSEFALSYCCDLGYDKQLYAPLILNGLLKTGTVKKWPNELSTPQEAEAYFRDRDGSAFIKDVVKEFPNLAVTIFASRLDHLQRQSDHPHIALQYNAWLDERPRFVRLNPDPVYVEQASGMRAPNFVNNQPNSPVEADEMDKYLEPEGLIPDYVFMEAAVAELADRIKAGKLTEALEEPLCAYSNGAVPPSNSAKQADAR